MKKRAYRPYEGKRRHPLLRILLALLGIGMVCFGALEIWVSAGAGDRLVGEPEVMVVFGCQVKPWGPSILLQDRLDTALNYLEDHPDMTVVVAGGKGDDEHVSEARCMYDYLVAHGVDEARILQEDHSRNTWENINFSLEIIEQEGLDLSHGVLLVSSGFHLSRIRMLWARATGSEYDVSTLAAPVSHRPSAVQMFFREPLALAKSFLFDRTIPVQTW